MPRELVFLAKMWFCGYSQPGRRKMKIMPCGQEAFSSLFSQHGRPAPGWPGKTSQSSAKTQCILRIKLRLRGQLDVGKKRKWSQLNVSFMLSLILKYVSERFMNNMGTTDHDRVPAESMKLIYVCVACVFFFQRGPRWSWLCTRVLRCIWVTRLWSPASTASPMPTTSPALSWSSGLWWVLLDPLRKTDTASLKQYPAVHVWSRTAPFRVNHLSHGQERQERPELSQTFFLFPEILSTEISGKKLIRIVKNAQKQRIKSGHN